MSAQSASSIPGTAAYAPADSLAFVSVNLDSDSAQWTQAGVLGDRLGQTISPEALVQQLLGAVAGDASAFDVTALLSGDLAVVVTDPSLAGGLPGLSLTSVLDDPSSVLDEASSIDASSASGIVLVSVAPNPVLVAGAVSLLLSSRAQSTGAEVTSTTYDDVTIASIPADTDAGTPGLAAATIDDAVIIATTPEDLQPIIDLRHGTGSSLADDETVAKVLAPLPADRLATAIVNGPAIAAYATDDPTAAGTLSPVLGSINAVSAVSIAAGADGFKIDLRSASPDGAPIFGMNDSFDSTLIDRMPADTQVFVNGYDFGSTGLLDSAVAVLSNLFLGQLSGMFVPGDFGNEAATPAPTAATPVPTLQETADTAYSTLSFLLGFNPKSDLIALLDGEYAFGLWGLNGADPTGVSAAFVSETSDPATVSSSVGTLIGFLGFGLDEGATVGTTRIGDSTVNSIDISGLGAPSPLLVGVVDGALTIGLGSGGDAAISGSTDSLADDALFQAATADLPTDRNALLYVNVGSLESTVDAELGTDTSTVQIDADALAIAGFKDGDMAGAQGLLYIPAN